MRTTAEGAPNGIDADGNVAINKLSVILIGDTCHSK